MDRILLGTDSWRGTVPMDPAMSNNSITHRELLKWFSCEGLVMCRGLLVPYHTDAAQLRRLSLLQRYRGFRLLVPFFLKITVGARGHGFEPFRRPIVFARTKRSIGDGSRPPKGIPWVTILVYATLRDQSIS